MSLPSKIDYLNAWHHMMNYDSRDCDLFVDQPDSYQFMPQEQDEDLVRLIEGKKTPAMIGSEKFQSWIKRRFFKQKKIRRCQPKGACSGFRKNYN